MRKQFYLVILCFVLMNSIVCAATYNATTDYSLASNPNGVWSYGYMSPDLNINTFSLYTTTASSFWLQWYTPGISGDSTPAIAYNSQPTVQYGVAPGQLTLHPGPAYQASVLRFTAPIDGTYNFVGQFFAGHTGIMSVAVRKVSTMLWSASDAGSFNLTQTITAGTVMDFMVYGGYGAGNTPIALVVTGPDPIPIPEPNTCLFLGIALSVLAMYCSGKKQ